MKKIIHIDMDCFYAQVEMRDNPSLMGKPVAIGGIMEGRGVLCTSNYEARKYGVRAAMPTALALKKCPHLILIPPNFQKYSQESERIFEVFKQFTKKIERLSLDEAYLDVTDCKKLGNDAIAIANEIKRRIYGKTKLTCSAGVSYNKLLAKIGSDLYKPNGLAVLREENIEKKISHFPISKIWGVGKVTQEKMKARGIESFGDLQDFTKLDLINMYGDFGAVLFNFCRGVDNREVEGGGERKSLSVEHTYGSDIDDMDELLIKLETCFEDMKKRLVKHQDRFIKNILVKIKYHDFESTTIESKMEVSFENYKRLFKKRFNEKKKPVRLLGVGVKFHSSETKGQLEFIL